MGAGPLVRKLARPHGLYSPRVCGVTLVGIRNPLNELIHSVYNPPGSVLGPVDTRSRERGLLPGGSSGLVSVKYSFN